jgi:putative endonuclease
VTPLEDFQQQSHTRGRGRLAEAEGVAWLQGHGYRILERNVEYKAGEIDVVALEGDTLCFIEIKARATSQFGEAVRAVTRRKQRQIATSATLFLAAHPHEGPCRFDVLAMDGTQEGWRFTLLRDAFQLE